MAFKYRERSVEAAKKRATQSTSLFDPFLHDQIVKIVLKPGQSRLRILPPTWDDPDHYGYDIWVHYGIGPDRVSYLCLHKMQDKPCPLCDKQMEARAEGDEELMQALKPTKRVLVWVIDRDNEDVGPQIWDQPVGVDNQFAKLIYDERSGELLRIDHPEDGYDIDITREGKGLKTKWVGHRIARRSSPLSDNKKEQDAWLSFVDENPIPECLAYFDYDHIMSVYGGMGQRPKAHKEEEEEERPRSQKSRRHDEEEEEYVERRSTRSHREEEEEEPPARTTSRRKYEEEEEDRPASRKKYADEPEDEPPSKEEKPSGRRSLRERLAQTETR